MISLTKPQNKKLKRKRGRPSLGPRVPLKIYVRPDVAISLRELAEVRQVPANLIAQVALDHYFRSLTNGDDFHTRQSVEGAARTLLSDRSAERAIREHRRGVPRG
jgi:hypothetical protein